MVVVLWLWLQWWWWWRMRAALVVVGPVGLGLRWHFGLWRRRRRRSSHLSLSFSAHCATVSEGCVNSNTSLPKGDEREKWREWWWVTLLDSADLQIKLCVFIFYFIYFVGPLFFFVILQFYGYTAKPIMLCNNKNNNIVWGVCYLWPCGPMECG